MSREIIICADAYPRIRNTLHIVTQNYRKYPITILVAGSGDLLKFFKTVNEKLFNNEIKLVYFDLFQPDPRRAEAKGLTKILYILPDIIKERRYLQGVYDKYLSRFKECDVYIFSRGFVDFYIARRLRKRNRLIYISSYPTKVTPEQYTPLSIIDIAKLIIAKLVYGRGIALGKHPHLKGFRHMSDGFLKKKIDTVISDEGRDEMMKDFDMNRFKIFDVGKHSVIYFAQTLIEDNYIVDDDTYRREMGEIFSIISKYFPENEIAIKYHPSHSGSEKTVVKVGDVLPDYIPAELMYDDSVKIYLCIWSNSVAYVEKGLVVSIMYLISLKNNEKRNTIKEMLKDVSRSEILFPETLDEFEKILAGTKKPQM